MTCDDFQEDASRFMDRMLDASGQVRLFAHLSNCSDCRSFLASSVRLREVIQEDTTSLPAGVDEELFERLSGIQVLREVNHNRPQPFWRREVILSFPLAVAAALLVILASVLFSLQFARTSAGSSTLQTVLDRTQAGPGKQTVVVVYQLPEEQVVSVPPSKIFEVKARTVAD